MLMVSGETGHFVFKHTTTGGRNEPVCEVQYVLYFSHKAGG